MLSKTKKILKLYYTFGDFFKKVWLNRRQLDSLFYVILFFYALLFLYVILVQINEESLARKK